MKYNYKKIRKKVYSIVKKAAYSKNNKFECNVWDFHILPVIKYALKLGKEIKNNSANSLKIDLEVLELSALLHDYANLIENGKNYKEHHKRGAKLAGDILKKLKFPDEKIIHVEDCIFSHRGSVKIRRNSIEASILASADGMAHITELADMFFLAFHVHGLKTKDGTKWLKAKLKRDWNKIIPQGRNMIKEDYRIANIILNKVINRKKYEA